jgi:hypothetical protein
MAKHGDTTFGTAEGNDYAAHEASYEGFIKLLKYSTFTVIAVVVLMAIFLV